MLRKSFWFAAGLLVICAGCSVPPKQRAENLDPMLSAAGFHMVQADTPSTMDKLKSLPPLQVKYYPGKDGKLHYWLADPYACHCLYIGNEKAYQSYERLRLQSKIAREEQEAAQENLTASQNMMMYPFGFAGFGFGF